MERHCRPYGSCVFSGIEKNIWQYFMICLFPGKECCGMNVALILSGGTGTRLGLAIPKQYIEVEGKPVISYCIETLSRHRGIDAIQIVAEELWRDSIREYMKTADVKGKFQGFSAPGENRQLSVYHGLEDIRGYAEEEGYVLVHDAARPLLTSELISQCLNCVQGHDGLMPVLPMKDTVYSSTDGLHITGLLDRGAVMPDRPRRFFGLAGIMRRTESYCRSKFGRSTDPQSQRCWMGWIWL